MAVNVKNLMASRKKKEASELPVVKEPKYILTNKTAEAVLYGHPDKVADCIADNILDKVLQQDPNGHCAVEVLVTGNTVVLAGEILATGTNLNIEEIVRQTIVDLGYTQSRLGFNAFTCKIINLIQKQSPNLAQLQTKENSVAGDQGTMFGYATDESPDYLPLALSISRQLLFQLDGLNLPKVYTDGKALASVEFTTEPGAFPKLRYLGMSIHSERAHFPKSVLIQKLQDFYGESIEIPTGFPLEINPAGPFTIGGPTGDTGLTGRKLNVDQYGGEVPFGGGAFSGKDPTKVDRSAAYYARYVAKNLVAAGCCKKALVQISYMIGQEEPVSVVLNTFGTNQTKLSDSELIEKLREANVFDFRVEKIITSLGLRNPIYYPTSKFGHFGIVPFKLKLDENGPDVTFYSWEETNLVPNIRDIVS